MNALFDRMSYLLFGICRLLGMLCMIVVVIALFAGVPDAAWPGFKAGLWMLIFGNAPALIVRVMKWFGY